MEGALIMFGTMALIVAIFTLYDQIALRRNQKSPKR